MSAAGGQNQKSSNTSSYDDGPAEPVRTSHDNTRTVGPEAETGHSSQYWYNTPSVGPEMSVNQLRRSSSYPDFRHGSTWDGGNQFRFYDDTEVNFYKMPADEKPPVSDYVDGGGQRSDEESEVKVIPVDTFEIRSSLDKGSSPASPAESTTYPQPSPQPTVNLKQRRSYRSVAEKEKLENPSVVEVKVSEVRLDENRSPPPPLPTLSPEVQPFPEQNRQTLQRKKSGAAKEITTASLYNQQKRKKKSKKRNVEESSSEGSPPTAHPTVPLQTPPPPPPPPPQFKVFQNPFKKSSKSKRLQRSEIFSAKPPPPPPPPPNSIFNNIFKPGNRSKRYTTSGSSPRPPPPPPPSSILNTWFNPGSKSNRFKSESSRKPPPPPPPPPIEKVSSKRKSKTTVHYSTAPSSAAGKPPVPAKPSLYSDEYLNSGSQSPLMTIPPPPPLPPFKMPEFKFVARGDFVKIRSASGSRCSSPGLEDVDVETVKSSDQMDGSDSIGPSVFCPSPDVNVKAASFIARLKDEWRLEKMNSIKEKLGPSPTSKLD